MFCGKCGTKNEDNAEFCRNCGAKLKNSTITTMSTQDDKNRKVGMIAVAIAAVAIIILGIFLFGGRSYKSTVKKFVDAQFDGNAEVIFDLLPKKIIDYALEQEGYDSDDLDELIADANEELQEQMDSLDSYLGEGWEVSYEILDDVNVNGDDLEDIKDGYEDADIKVSAAKNVEIEVTVTAGETESSNTQDISLIKVGRSWYIDVMSMGNLF